MIIFHKTVIHPQNKQMGEDMDPEMKAHPGETSVVKEPGICSQGRFIHTPRIPFREEVPCCS